VRFQDHSYEVLRPAHVRYWYKSQASAVDFWEGLFQATEVLFFFSVTKCCRFSQGPSFRGDFCKGLFPSYTIQAYKYLRVPPLSSFKRLIIRTKLCLSPTMSVPLKSPEGLKDSECEKGNLLHCPPIPYIPPTDLLPAIDKIETIKIKVADGSTVNMKNFSIGSPEEYLGHIVAVLDLIDRKRFQEQSTTFYGEMKNANAALLALKCKARESKKDKSPRKDQEADDEQSDESPQANVVEKNQFLEILKNAKKHYAAAIGATFKVMRNLLAGDPQTQWDHIIEETRVTRGLVQMGRNTREAKLSATRPFPIAGSCISSRCSPRTLPKGSGTTSNREYASPRGLVYASSSPGCNS
jgi:hypothetical protein